MPRNITVTFSDGMTHVYQNAPDNLTPNEVSARAFKEFGKAVKSLDGGGATPTTSPTPTRLQNLAGDFADVAGPTIESLGALGGGFLGAGTMLPTGPGAIAGGAFGAGLGYATGKNVVNMLNEYAGRQPPLTVANALTRSVGDVTEGVAMEAAGLGIGRVVGPLLPKIGRGVIALKNLPNHLIAKTTNAVNRPVGDVIEDVIRGAAALPKQMIDPVLSKIDKTVNHFKNLPKQRAANIARGAVGSTPEEVNALINVLRNADSSLSAGQAASGTINPAFQALVERSLERDPKFLNQLTDQQNTDALNKLAQIVGARTQTGARTSQKTARDFLNESLEPSKQMALTRAGMGQDVVRFENQAAAQVQNATDAVKDVRRFTAVGERARNAHNYPVLGYPRVSSRYSYKGELADRADDVTEQAARASLDFGQLARSNGAVAQTLRERGIKPLKPDAILSQLRSTMSKPEYAGNRDVSTVLRRVADDITQWSGSSDIVLAMDSIRKNSVNGAIRDLYPQADNKVQKKLAAELLTQVRPLIVNAIEGAGGIGYRDYLKAYEKGAQAIGQKKLGAEALRMFQDNPKDFVRLVDNDLPDAVEKVFGPGKYDIEKEMAAGGMESLRSIADNVKRKEIMIKQADMGRVALREVFEANTRSLRLPSFMSAKVTLANNALDGLQDRIGRKTMNILTEAMKSGKSAAELLNTLPASERTRVLSILKNPSPYIKPGVYAAVGGNALSEEEPQQPVNTLSR